MKDCLERYDFEFNDKKDDPDRNCYILENASSEEIMTEWLKIVERIKNDRQKRYLVFCLFAGHGMIKDNEQVVLCNSFQQYYKPD